MTLWTNDLWNDRRCAWHDGDQERIRTAFQRLRSNSRRWPQMADFWSYLPSREAAGPALPARILSAEERAENIRKLAEMGRELLGITKP